MKIAPLIAIIVTLGLGVAGFMFSSQQQTTMKLVVGVAGGPDGSGGLKAVNQSLDGNVASISGERKKALEACAEAATMLQRSAEELAQAENELSSQESALADMQEKVKEAKGRQDEIQAELDALLAFFRSLPALSSVSDLNEAVAALESTVNEEKEKASTLSSELESKVTVRDAAAKKVATETAELERLDGANRRFEDEYRKNDDEFTILAVDPRWKFVVFNVGKDSGIVTGDSNPLLVKRGDVMIAKLRVISITGNQVIAEFKSEELPAGVMLEVGDRVFMQKPIGS
ncbi:MAG: hypothetical protein Q4F40_03845 [Akkermansia sp.]|nr:hypothetical protein [Akkermansia sp.]